MDLLSLLLKPFHKAHTDAPRIIVYGDIHGCLEELKLLREKLAPEDGDIEISLGDIVNKGPYSKELIKYLACEGIKGITGNHEEKAVRYRYHELNGKGKNPVYLSSSQQDVYDELDDECFEYLFSMVCFMRFGKLTLLHAGMTNSMKLDSLTKKEQQLIMHIRWLDRNEHFVSLEETKSRGDHFWASVYDGHEGFIVYGHQPFKSVRKDRYALGIDTGCVYGNKLTAAIFHHIDGEVDDVSFEIAQVNALERYAYKGDWD